jgi:hypothetical protein
MADLYTHTVTLYIRVYEPHPPPGERSVAWHRRVLPRTRLRNGQNSRDGRTPSQTRLTIPVRPDDHYQYRSPTWDETMGFYALPAEERRGFWTVSAGIAPGGGDLVFNGIGPETDETFRETWLLSRYPDRAWKVRSVRDNSTADPQVAHIAVTD